MAMRRVEIIDSGHVDRRDSAFPTLVWLDGGDILCAFSVGGGPNVEGGTQLARSNDGGISWTCEGPILAKAEDPTRTNSLRLSRTADCTVLAYGQRNYPDSAGSEFGRIRNEPVLCRSTDGGRTWSDPEVIQTGLDGPFEISNPIVVLDSGRWLAPAATLSHPDRLGERVVAFVSPDQGCSWPETYTVLRDPEGAKGFFEQKIIELQPNRLLAVAWTVSLGDYRDLEDHFAISRDGGHTWAAPRSTGIRGQTMTPFWLGKDRLFVLYNRRYGAQAVMMYLVRFTDQEWVVEWEDVLWDARASYHGTADAETGIDEFSLFAFGLPSALRLDAHNLLAVHWCKEDGVFGIRWTRLRVA